MGGLRNGKGFMKQVPISQQQEARRRDLPVTLGSGGGLSGGGSVSVLYTSAELNCIAGRVTCMHGTQISAACPACEKRFNAGGAHCQHSTSATHSLYIKPATVW